VNITINMRSVAGFILSASIVLLASCASQKEEEPKELTADQIRIQELVKFGPDPYKASAPVAAKDNKEEKARLAAIRAEFKLVHKLLQTDEAAAEAELQKMVDKFPTYSGAAYNLAVLEKKRGNIKKAKEHLKIAITRNDKNLDARALQALIAREEGDFASAEKGYKEILALWGGYLSAYKNLGILYDLYMGDPEKALPYYKKYNYFLAVPDKQVNGYIIDIERRVGAQPAPAQQAVEEPTTESPVGQ